MKTLTLPLKKKWFDLIKSARSRTRFSKCKGNRQLHRNSENLQTKSLFPKRKDEARITERKFKEAK